MDQLPADRRAIIELVLRRGWSYAQLSELLELPESRVRGHARDALAALAPRSAERVDPHWRDQVADYVLGQQAGPQAKATRSHLKASEPARTWALSVLDSVGHLYPAGAEPDVPEGGGRAAEEKPARHGARRRKAAASSQGSRGRDGTTAPAAPAALRGKETAPDGGSAATTIAEEGEPATETAAQPPPGRSASPSRTSAPDLRRRIAAALVGVLVVAGVVALVTGAFGGDDDSGGDDVGADAAAASGESEVVTQLLLRPVGDGRGAAVAVVAEQAGQPVMILQGRVPEIGRDQRYVVWLYSNPRNALAVAVPRVDRQGALQALAPLPPGWERFRFVDISVQGRGDRARHSGNSVLRAPIERVASGTTAP